MDLPELKEVLYEIHRAGNGVKVTAIDPVTGMETTVLVPANLTTFSMKLAAKRKLAYVIAKRLEFDK